MIVQKMRLRDEESLAETQRKYRNLMYFVAYNVLGSAADADECVNDALLEIWNSIPPQDPSSMESYAAMVARRIAIDRVRYYKAQKRDATVISFDGLENIAESSDVSENQLADLLNDFLGRLGATDRKVFMQKYYLCVTAERIGENLGLSTGTVLSKLSRTREKLRKYLAGKGIDV